MNAKQKLFCQYYLETFNATQSAILAGYSAKTAYSIGSRLLKNVEIQKTIREEVQSQKGLLPCRAELMKFWCEIMRNSEEKTSNRLAASLYLAKSKFMFDPDLSSSEDWE